MRITSLRSMIERCQDTQGMAACCVVLMLWLIGANTSIIPSMERTDETSHSIWTRLKGLSRFRNWSFFYSRNSTTLAHGLCQVLQLGLNCKGMFPQCFLARNPLQKPISIHVPFISMENPRRSSFLPQRKNRSDADSALAR